MMMTMIMVCDNELIVVYPNGQKMKQTKS